LAANLYLLISTAPDGRREHTALGRNGSLVKTDGLQNHLRITNGF
jgi:hypothetical protein